MNVDRSLFLAFAASLSAAAAVGCSSEDTTASDAPEMNEINDYCWAPATESASGPGQRWYVEQLGFDAANDYPSAEGFCMSFVWPNGFTSGPSEMSLWDKCQGYGRNYVPMTTYSAFLKMKRMEPGLDTFAKFSALYEFDRSLAGDSVVCQTEPAGRICGGHDAECNRIASQLRPEALPQLEACMDQGFSAYSCIEGAGNHLY